MKRKIICLFLLVVIFPMNVLAKDDETVFEIKYYKTVTINDNKTVGYMLDNNYHSYTEEITQEEYDSFEVNYNINPLDYSNGQVETNYKKMTTSISKTNSGYRYKVVLDWKTIPSVRSYDIIGIGFPASVKPESSIVFRQNYCFTDGNCYTGVSCTPYNGVNGVGASFSLPGGTLKSLNQTLYVDMKKTDDATTIIKQYAYGDYSHATKTISYDDSKKYVISSGGIILNSSIQNYYDYINTATATWTGTW